MRKSHKSKKQLKRKTKRSTKKNTSKKNWLEKATAAFYASMSPDQIEEENRLGLAVAAAASHINFYE
jgi:hypothetical protein